jgi:hypothetical protein
MLLENYLKSLHPQNRKIRNNQIQRANVTQ